MPFVGVTFASRSGYFRQLIEPPGHQVEQPETWRLEQWAVPLQAKVAVQLEGRTVWICAWLYVVEGLLGRQPVLLLDTDLAANDVDDWRFTDQIYDGHETYRLRQEAVLGIGGVRMLQALGFRVLQYHMNEGHAARLGLELLRRYAFEPRLRGLRGNQGALSD